jgi:hypothetical protein
MACVLVANKKCIMINRNAYVHPLLLLLSNLSLDEA